MPVTPMLQALVLFEERNVKDYGLALWAALHEVEQFFKPLPGEHGYTRYFISSSQPESGIVDTVMRTLGRLLFNTKEIAALDVLQSKEFKPIPKAATDDQERRLVEAGDLAKMVRGLIGRGDELPMLIVTDRPLRPPPGWRYMIWKTLENRTGVLSVAPLDPLYWRESDPERIMTIKSRLRSAALAVTGDMLGLDQCSDRNCVMFRPVDSVLDLDDMVTLGGGHRTPELEHRRFDERVDDPTQIQPVCAAIPPVKP